MKRMKDIDSLSEEEYNKMYEAKKKRIIIICGIFFVLFVGFLSFRLVRHFFPTELLTEPIEVGLKYVSNNVNIENCNNGKNVLSFSVSNPENEEYNADFSYSVNLVIDENNLNLSKGKKQLIFNIDDEKIDVTDSKEYGVNKRIIIAEGVKIKSGETQKYEVKYDYKKVKGQKFRAHIELTDTIREGDDEI